MWCSIYLGACLTLYLISNMFEKGSPKRCRDHIVGHDFQRFSLKKLEIGIIRVDSLASLVQRVSFSFTDSKYFPLWTSSVSSTLIWLTMCRGPPKAQWKTEYYCFSVVFMKNCNAWSKHSLRRRLSDGNQLLRMPLSLSDNKLWDISLVIISWETFTFFIFLFTVIHSSFCSPMNNIHRGVTHLACCGSFLQVSLHRTHIPWS